jgi:hypothetical protein
MLMEGYPIDSLYNEKNKIHFAIKFRFDFIFYNSTHVRHTSGAEMKNFSYIDNSKGGP